MNDLQSLFENKLDYILIDNFLTSEQVELLLNAITRQPEWQEAQISKKYEHLFKGKEKPKHLCLSQYMVLSLDMNEGDYLELCRQYYEIWQRVVKECGFDPFKKLVNYLNDTYNIAVQPAAKNDSRYFPLVARDLAEEVLPHADFGPYDGPDWIINTITNQLAWNIYLTDPKKGGETTIYNQIWSDADTLDEDSYGIKDFAADVKCQFSVKPGRLVIFNSRNFHAVNKSAVPRIAIGGLIGKTKKGEYIAWG